MASAQRTAAAAVNNNRDAVLVQAVYEARWADVGRLLERGVSDTSHQWVVKRAGERLEGSALASYILPHSRDDQLDVLLPEVVRRGQWWVVGQLLKRGVGDNAQRMQAVKEAGKRARDTQLATFIVPHCTHDQTESLLTDAVKRGLWESVSKLLNLGVSDECCRWAVGEASTRAEDNVFMPEILCHCQDNQMDSVMTTVVRRHLWHGVCWLLQQNIDIKLRKWAVEEAVQNADCTQQTCILPYCTDDHLEYTLRLSVKKGLWQCVGQLLQRTAGTTLHTWAVAECSKHSVEKDLMKHILPCCSDAEAALILGNIVKRDLWGAVASILLRHSDCITGDRRENLFVKASRRASEACLIHRFILICPDDYLHSVAVEVIKRGLWEAAFVLLKHGLKDSQRKWVGEEVIGRANSHFLSIILPICCPGHFELLFMTAIRRRCWDGVLVLLKCEVTDSLRGWAVEEVSKVAKEHFLITEVLDKCPDANADAVVDILVRRKLWKAVACSLKSQNVGVAQCGKAFEEASKKVKESTLVYTMDIEHQCPDLYIHSVLRTLVKRGFWAAVSILLRRNMSDEDWFWVMEKACKMADEKELIQCVTDCPKANVDPLLDTVLKRQLWGAAGTLLSHNARVSQGQCLLAVQTASKLASERRLIDDILIHCPKTKMVESVLETLLRRGLWQAIGYLLSKHSVSESLRGRIAEEVSHSVNNRIILWDVLRYCPDSKIDSVLTTLVKRGQLQAIPPMMDRNVAHAQRVLVVKALLMYAEENPKMSYDDRLAVSHALLKLDNAQVDLVLSELAEKDEWHLFQRLCCGTELFDRRETAERDVYPTSVSVTNGATLLHVFCAAGLWRTFSVFVHRGIDIDPLCATASGLTLLNFAVIGGKFPGRMVAECIKLGLGTHQPEFTSQAKDKYKILIAHSTKTILGRRIHVGSPMECAITRGSTILMEALYKSGASSQNEVHRLHLRSVLLNPDEDILSDTQRKLKNVLEKLATTPRSLQSLCRLVISHHLGVGGGREERVRQLPLPNNLQMYVQFTDLVQQLIDQNHNVCKFVFFEAMKFVPIKRMPFLH